MVPIQFAPELLIIALIGLFFLIVPFALAYYVYTDANARGNDKAAIWAVVVGGLTFLTFFGGILAFVIYIWDRD